MIFVVLIVKIVCELGLIFVLLRNNFKNRSDKNYFFYALLFLMLISDLKVMIQEEQFFLINSDIISILVMSYFLLRLTNKQIGVKSIITNLIDVQELGNAEILDNIDEAVAIVRKDDLSIIESNQRFKDIVLTNQHFINLEDIISSVNRGENTFEIKDFNNIKMFIRVRLVNYGTKNVALFIEDITEISMIKREMTDQAEYYQNIWKTSPNVVVIREMFGRIVFMNGQAEIFFQKTAKDCEGKYFETLFEYQKDKKWHLDFEQMRSTDESCPNQSTANFKLKSGNMRYFDIEESIIHYQRSKHIFTRIVDLTDLYFLRMQNEATMLFNNAAAKINNRYIIIDLIHNKVLGSERIKDLIGFESDLWDLFWRKLDDKSQHYIRFVIEQPQSFKAERIMFDHHHDFIIERIINSEQGEVLGLVLNLMNQSHDEFDEELIGKNIINNIKEGVLIINFDGAIEYGNEAVCSLLGYTKLELLEMSIMDVTKDITIEGVRKNWESTRNNETLKFDRLYISKQNQEIPVELTGRHIAFEDKEKLLILVKDASEKYIYKRKFSDSQIKFSQLFDAMQDGIFEIKLPKMNVNFYQQFDVERGFVGVETTYLEWINTIHMEDQSIVYESIDTITSEKKDELIFEYRYKNKTKWEWMRTKGSYIEDEEGASIILINRNINEIKEIMIKLEESKYILTESERISHMAHWRFDVSRSIFEVSETFKDVFNVQDDSGEITHEQLNEFIHPSDIKYFENKLNRAIWEEESLDLIFRITRSANTRFIQSFGKTYYSKNKMPLYVIGNSVDITEKMVAERRLESSKKLLEGIIEQSPTGIIVTKRNGRIEVMNEEAERLLDIKDDFELTVQKIEMFIVQRYELEGEGDLSSKLKSIALGQAMNLTLKCRVKNQPQWLMLYASPMHDEEKRFTGSILIFIDISDRTVMQAQLMERTSKLINAEKLAKLGHFEFEEDFKKLYASEEIYNIMEIQGPIEFTTTDFLSRVEAEDRQRIIDIVQVIQRQEGQYTLEFKIRSFKDNIRHIQIFVIKRIENNRNIFEGTFQDVTVVNSVMEKIRQSEREKDTLISSVSDQITYYNDQMEIVTLNHTKHKNLYHNGLQIIGSKCYDVFSTKAAECEECIIKKTLETEKPLSREYERDHYWFEQTTHPVFDDHGKIVGVVEIVRDITQDKFIREKQASLDKMQVFDQASKGIALDYNNKLMGIMGYLNLINDFKTLPKTVREYISIITKTAMTLQETTDHLLMLNNSSTVNLIKINIVHSVDNAVKFINHMYDMKCEIITKYPEEQPLILGNEDMIFNMLISILINGLDAVESKSNPRVEVKVEVDAFQNRVSICIRDNGIGIKPELNDRIFEPFFSTKNDPNKAGMGLTTVKSILKEIGGSLAFNSEQGSTEFVITLNTLDDQSEVLQNEEILMKDPNKRGVLVIDDEEIVRMLFVNVLDDQGYLVFEASNAYEGMSIYKENQSEIELVIMDMIMPEMNGRETFDALKNIDPEVKIIVTTGYSEDKDVRYVMENGAVDLLKKPVAIGTIKKRVANHFSQSFSLNASQKKWSDINVKEALRKLEGNQGLYERICKKFYLKYSDLPDEIMEALSEDNWVKIRTSAHNIKGLAGNIGDDNLESVCYQLETAIRENSQDHELTIEFVDALTRLLNYLKESIEE